MKGPSTIPTLWLERYLLGELPSGRRRRLEQELRRDPALRERLQALREADAAILARYPAERLAGPIRARAGILRATSVPAAGPAVSRRWPWLLPAASLAAFVLIISLSLLVREDPVPEPYTGIKGGSPPSPSLQVFRKRGAKAERLEDGAAGGAGDLLQLACRPAGSRHGVIVSIDGRGGVTLHFPATPNAPTDLGGPGPQFLPQAFELDDAPGFERFLLVTSGEGIPVAEVMARARELAADPGRAQTGRLDLPGRFRQTSLLLRKGERR